MSSEFLPATNATQQELVLLHGWGSNREIWRPLLQSMRPWADITLLELPGCAPGALEPVQPDLDYVYNAILAIAPASAVYVGWSLGGQLAQALASRYPDRVKGLVTICANPCFVADEDWPGMAPPQFAEFRASVAVDPAAALRRFDSLQVAGARQPRQLLRQLARQDRQLASTQLLSGLQWLQELDGRAALPKLSQPQLHIHGARDALVPLAVNKRLGLLLQGVRGAQLCVLPDASHVAPLDSSANLGREIRRFLSASKLLHPRREERNVLAKAEVADSFSRAAGLYDSVATLQQDVGRELLAGLDGLEREPASVLDLGCGTGFFFGDLRRRFPAADYIGLDLAQGMVEFARARCADDSQWLVADAEALPLAADSVDLVFSSLAIQWCDRPQHLFAELARVLRPGGCCVFTSLGPETLRELRAAWAAVDSYQHVNTFLPTSELEAAARAVPGIRLRLGSECFQMQYQRVRELLDELKTLGAHNMNRGRPAGLTSRAGLQGMLRAYEVWRKGGSLPATYDVIFGVVEAV